MEEFVNMLLKAILKNGMKRGRTLPVGNVWSICGRLMARTRAKEKQLLFGMATKCNFPQGPLMAGF
jgi:hypothetical protein